MPRRRRPRRNTPRAPALRRAERTRPPSPCAAAYRPSSHASPSSPESQPHKAPRGSRGTSSTTFNATTGLSGSRALYVWASPRLPVRSEGTPVSAPIETCRPGASVASRGQHFLKSSQPAREPPSGTRRRGGLFVVGLVVAVLVEHAAILAAGSPVGRAPAVIQHPRLHALHHARRSATPADQYEQVRKKARRFLLCPRSQPFAHKPVHHPRPSRPGETVHISTPWEHPHPEDRRRGARDFPVTRAVHYHQPTRPIRQRHKGIDIPCHPRSVRC